MEKAKKIVICSRCGKEECITIEVVDDLITVHQEESNYSKSIRIPEGVVLTFENMDKALQDYFRSQNQLKET